MIPTGVLSQTVTIKRRTSTGRDSLNNPTYGAPTSGTGWDTVYNSVPVRLAFSSKAIRFVADGERVTPQGVVYLNTGYTILPEDRIITSDGIEYVVISVVEGRMGAVVNHLELIIGLP